MNKALFLDRDGVINHDSTGYTYKIEDFSLIDGIVDVMKHAKDCGYLLIIVTNQSGIARGYYTVQQFESFMNHMYNKLAEYGIRVDKTYFCPHHVDGIIPEFTGESNDRKPNPGMILKAKDEFDIDLSQSILIGDKETDINAAKNAGVGKYFLFTKSKHEIKDYFE